MEFLNPSALYALFLLPLLLIPYLIKGHPRPIVFSSLLLLKDISSRSGGSPWGSLLLPPIFFLQLLFLLLLILALGEPVFSFRPQRVALVLDNSASMQTMEGGRSRFEMARRQAEELLVSLSGNARVDLFLMVPRLERVGEEALSPAAALAAIAPLRPYDVGEPALDYGAELARLVQEKGYERLFLLTDRPFQGRAEAIKVISVGRPQENLAITSFDLSHSSFTSSELEARVAVVNFSNREWRFKLSLKGGGRILASRTQAIAAGKSAQISFRAFPLHPYYEAELEVRDGLALDNRRFAILSGSKGLKILGISPRPDALASLRSIPGVDLKVVSPEQYRRSAEGEHALEIFHFSAPSAAPQSNSLFILPPKENPLVLLERSAVHPVITGWREPHALTRYVNFTLFRPSYARALKPLSAAESIIVSPDGPVALVMEQRGFRYLVLGFDPFPYLGGENLPVSIFTLNFLKWFSAGAAGLSVATGERLHLPPRYQGGILMTPKGDKIPIEKSPGLFSTTFYQGIYQAVQGERAEFMAVNFNDASESDLRNPLPIDLKGEAGLLGRQSLFFPLWAYILFLSLLLLLVEWFLNPPLTEP